MTLRVLPDPLAVQILSAVAGPRLRDASALPPDADIVEALAEAFSPAADTTPPTQADLARAALALAAEEPKVAALIESRAEGGGLEAFPVGETIALLGTVTAAIAILQTEVSFERAASGKWKIKLHKRPASDALLKALAQAVMRALGATGHESRRLPK
jgi:hypothetical protein